MAFLPSPITTEMPPVSTVVEEDTAFIPTPQRADNEAIWELADYVNPTLYDNKHVFLKFKEEFDFNKDNFFKEHSLAFGLSDNDEIRLVKQNDRVLKYQQFYKGIKVQEGGYRINRNSSGEILRATGTIIENINIDIEQKILESDALQIILDSIGSEKYAWDNPELCKKLKEIGKKCFPKADLLITIGKTESFIASAADLNYIFKIYLDENVPSYTGIINASNGIITSLFQNINHNCTTAKVSTHHYGTRSFEVEKYAWEDDRVCNILKKVGRSCIPIERLIITKNPGMLKEASYFDLYYDIEIVTGGLEPITYQAKVNGQNKQIIYLWDGAKLWH